MSKKKIEGVYVHHKRLDNYTFYPGGSAESGFPVATLVIGNAFTEDEVRDMVREILQAEYVQVGEGNNIVTIAAKHGIKL